MAPEYCSTRATLLALIRPLRCIILSQKRDTLRKNTSTAAVNRDCAPHNRQSGCANTASSASSNASQDRNKKHKVAANYNHAALDRDETARGVRRVNAPHARHGPGVRRFSIR